jgi:hypothetical protein
MLGGGQDSNSSQNIANANGGMQTEQYQVNLHIKSKNIY